MKNERKFVWPDCSEQRCGRRAAATSGGQAHAEAGEGLGHDSRGNERSLRC